MPDHPPTIIVVHRRENRKKCSVEPLRERAGFIFWTYPDDGPESLDGYVRLGIGGPLLTEADSANGLLVIDGTSVVSPCDACPKAPRLVDERRRSDRCRGVTAAQS